MPYSWNVHTSVSSLARAAQHAYQTGDHPGWFVFHHRDGSGTQETRVGIAAEVLTFEPGQEGALSASLQEDPGDDWILVLGYEFGRPLSVPRNDASEVPVALALRIPAYIAVDAATGTRRMEARRGTAGPMRQLHESLLEDDRGRIHSTGWGADARGKTRRSFSWRDDIAAYASRVRQAKGELETGHISVLCLTNRASVQTSSIDALATFERLQLSSPAPWSALIETPTHSLISASPETFFVLSDGHVVTEPIKGTRRRGGTASEDARLARELEQDPKEIRENQAVTREIVRKLEAICRRDTVAVTADCVVQSFAQVHQLVSRVEGHIHETERDDSEPAPVWRVLDALFPSVSMTGVPAEPAMDVLGRLEGGARGWYAGCYGWTNGSGTDACFAVTIRSIEVHGSTVSVGSGGGITRDSVPANEVAEMHLKAAALLNACSERPRS